MLDEMQTTDPHTSAQSTATRTAATATASTGSAAGAQAPASIPGVAPGGPGTEFVTGAYQLSGHASIDRMIQLEKALKRFGSPI